MPAWNVTAPACERDVQQGVAALAHQLCWPPVGRVGASMHGRWPAPCAGLHGALVDELIRASPVLIGLADFREQ